ncbi:hypothetical protein CGLO_18286 [Colletotrichum gloeosporioides Cg-14]|uniref:Uncharacterized protein n=1 Tax=Colletotrichum gloeosporioides (strain Cg-14) TaxID=1237896 RepID=T0JIB6_COLGC|nr:hypothetical protein CGLO_18286 [Colletotrichum gloeosporioides Cg-14]
MSHPSSSADFSSSSV